MVVFVDESGFVSSQAANLHIAKVYFACPYEEVVIAGQENPTKDKMNYFDNIVVWFSNFLHSRVILSCKFDAQSNSLFKSSSSNMKCDSNFNSRVIVKARTSN